MKFRRTLRWLLPLSAFLGGAVPGLAAVYWTKVLIKYQRVDGTSCLLARGYAREFELKEGRKPDMAELRQWAEKRFREDMKKVRIEADFRVVKKPGPFELPAER